MTRTRSDHMRRLVLGALALLLWVSAAQAQVAAALVADTVTVSGRVLTARGNVTAFAGGTRLGASEIRYDGVTDQLHITGPIVLTGAQGTVITATAADLNPELRSGLLIGARLVLDRRLQLAAGRADLAGARTQLTGVAVTSCAVCDGRAPLWSIRAGRVVHDADAQRLWFDEAQLRIRRMPLVTLPHLALPDPTATRMTGLLRPRLSHSSGLGTTLRLPYFLVLSPQRDLTLTPVIGTRALSAELRLRQALPGGGLSLTAMGGRTQAGLSRYFVEGTASAALPHDWRLDATLAALSDGAVIDDYGLATRERLHSMAQLSRISARQITFVTLARYDPLTTGEDPQFAPMTTATAWHQGRTPLAGGMLSWDLSAQAHRADAPGTTRGRIGAGSGYTHRWVFGPGLEAELRAALRYDIYDDTGPTGRAEAQLGLSWPLMRQAGSTTDVIAPHLRIGYLARFGTRPTNIDSTRLSFDGTTLDGRAPAPGEDLALPGGMASLGLSWTRMSDAGRSRIAFGRLLRAAAPDGVAASTGLASARSDWLLTAEAELTAGLRASTRMVIAPDGLQRSESRIGWQAPDLRVEAVHLHLAADLAEQRPDTITLLGFDADWNATPSWSFSGGARYDIAADRPVSAELGVTWRNECVRVGISASRRFETLSNVPATTQFGLDLSIDGFSAGQTGLRAARSCPPT